MPDPADDPAARLVEQARLDARAAALVHELSSEATVTLAERWDAAVADQDRQLREAVDGALGMLPRLLRRQVLRLLGGMLW